jgi:hypothetical protein
MPEPAFVMMTTTVTMAVTMTTTSMIVIVVVAWRVMSQVMRWDTLHPMWM